MTDSASVGVVVVRGEVVRLSKVGVANAASIMEVASCKATENSTPKRRVSAKGEPSENPKDEGAR
jgi:hypothetical protein